MCVRVCAYVCVCARVCVFVRERSKQGWDSSKPHIHHTRSHNYTHESLFVRSGSVELGEDNVTVNIERELLNSDSHTHVVSTHDRSTEHALCLRMCACV